MRIPGQRIRFNDFGNDETAKYDENYINWHANGPECNQKKQQSILCFLNPIVTDKEADDENNINSDDDWNDWKSEVEDTMDNNDIITVDENNKEINDEENVNIEIISPETNQTGVAVHAKEYIGYSESGKTICDECLILNIPKPAPENLKFTPKFYFKNNSLKKHLQNQDLHEIWTIIKDDYDTNVLH
ncbi:unnamed protein product [Rhizophagus irregularis]|nr:unnamed protein product [Rhizophagus irregularis]